MNNKFKFPLATETWDSKEISAINRVIKSNMYTMGKEVENFEKNFANFFGSRYAVMVNSGSSANLLMIAALFYTENSKFKLKPGDEIIVPAVSWSTSYSPLHQYGLKLRFVDIDIETLNYNLHDLKNSITKKTKAILVVNLLGNPNEFKFIKDIADKNSIFIIEDNCESMGAKYTDKYTGTFGIMGSFSTFFSHHISTMEGGIVLTNDRELFHIMLVLRAHGWTRNLPKNSQLKFNNNNSFYKQFDFILPGYNLRPLEFEGAIGSEQLKKLNKLIRQRRKNAEYFVDALLGNQDIIIQKEIHESSWFGFSLIVRPEAEFSRSDLLDRLHQIGFETRPIVTGNFTRSNVIKYFNYTISGKLTNADILHENGLFIGNNSINLKSALKKLKTL